MKFRTQFSQIESKPEVNDGVSETIQDQALTIEQIFQRYKPETIMTYQKSAVYNHESDLFPDELPPDLDNTPGGNVADGVGGGNIAASEQNGETQTNE